MNTTFTTIHGTTFEMTEKGYCYMTLNGKKTRCSKESYNTAYAAYIAHAEEREAQLDAAAENPEVSLEQFVELVQEAEESAKTEEAKEIVKELAPKTRKRPKRISKDIAYSYVQRDNDGNITLEVTLTTKQVDFIRHLPDTYFWENGVESIIWVDCLCDDIMGQFANKPMTVGAMISTLCEKGLGTRCTERKGPRGGKATSFALTELGKIVAAELGLH